VNGRRGEGQERIDREILGEKAAALGRAGERLEQALAELTGAAAALQAAMEPEARQRLAADYEAARARATQARLLLLIQREAVGLRNHRMVDHQYPEPPRPTPERATEPCAPRSGHPRSEPSSRPPLQ
jgi:hypothetical protein